MKVRDNELKGVMYREYYFSESDLIFEVEAYQYAEDEDRVLCDCEYEFEGGYLCEQYDKFKDAVKKCTELLDKGWEVIRLSIRIRSTIRKKTGEINLWFLGDLTGRSIMSLTINLTEINKEMSDKLAKIKQILESQKQ